jgi:hypothetical protein
MSLTDVDASNEYAPWERVIEGWTDFQDSVYQLSVRHSSRDLVWRGVRDARWGIQSSLYRALRMLKDGEPPTEDDVVRAERQILRLARRDWRFDGTPALELFAHLQHYGAPTRLLDVTENPLVALWFAVEARPKDSDSDSRVFAFVTNARPIGLNERWAGRYPRWHDLRSEPARRSVDWGTGVRRTVWRPPAYNERIASRSAAFLIDGVPIEAAQPARSDAYLAERELLIDIERMRRISSINLRFSRVERERLGERSAPVFTLRISANGKREIREQLENRFGMRASSIYSDMNGLASHLATHSELLLG